MVCKRIKDARKSKGMLGKDAAKLLGIAYSTYAKYESGERNPDINMLVTIADLFDVSTDYLLCRTDNPKTIKKELSIGGQPVAIEVDKDSVDAKRAGFTAEQEAYILGLLNKTRGDN